MLYTAGTGFRAFSSPSGQLWSVALLALGPSELDFAAGRRFSSRSVQLRSVALVALGPSELDLVAGAGAYFESVRSVAVGSPSCFGAQRAGFGGRERFSSPSGQLWSVALLVLHELRWGDAANPRAWSPMPPPPHPDSGR